MASWWRLSPRRVAVRIRRDGRPALLWSLRITIAAVASYVVATLIFPGTQPLLSPLTAMLVVQVTPVSLLASGVDRVVAVVTGVLLAVGFAAVAPLEWWSLGLLIFVSLTLGQALRLRANLIEVAISAMLVLGVGALAAETAAWQRITETLVGAAVGIATNLLFPPKVASADAASALDGLADTLTDLLRRAADELTELVSDDLPVGPAARGWLGEARRITHDIPRVGAAVEHAEQGRRLNVRAVGTPDVGPGLRQGIEALEHSAIAVRGMFRAVADATTGASERSWLREDGADDVLLGLAQTFGECGAAVDAFGQLVHDEADPRDRATAADVRALGDALDGLREARARLEGMLMADTSAELLELTATVLTTVKRLLRELDVEERLRRQVQLVRRLSAPPAVRPATTSEPDPDAETQLMPRLPARRRSRPRW